MPLSGSSKRMQMISAHEPSAGYSRLYRGSCSLWRTAPWMWIDVKSFMAGMLVVALVVVLQQNSRSNQLARAVTYLPSVNEDKAKDDASTLHTDSCMPASSSSGSSNISSRNMPSLERDQGSDESVRNDSQVVTTKRSFSAYGQALALFVHMGSYRGGPDSFAVIGLGAKPAHVYGDAGFECEWVPAGAQNSSTTHQGSEFAIRGKTVKHLPDWNLGRQYTVVVVNCTFERAVGIDREGGKLVVYALYGNGSGRVDTRSERFVALREKKGEYDGEKFRESATYRYDFVSCGSPLYGNLNAQRIREWVAYHMTLFGRRAHFVLYNAGGISASVEKVLRPWRERGFVSVQDIRELESYDGYYHNQFLVINDCLHRTRFLSPWTFFFDVDEYVYVPSHTTLHAVMQGFSNYTQVIFRQKPMAAHLCTAAAASRPLDTVSRMWGFEKLVYRNVKPGMVWNRKYAIQARNAFTAGVHRADDIVRNDIVSVSLGYFPESLVPNLWYYHFHNTITYNKELCTTFVEPLAVRPNITFNGSSVLADFVDTDGTPYSLDNGLQKLALSVKSFEYQCIGHFNST